MGNFSAMSVHLTGYTHNSTSGSSFQYDYASSYVVLESPKTGFGNFKTNFTETYSNPQQTAIAWMRPDGTIIAVMENGVNKTGTAALQTFSLFIALFQSEYFYGTYLQGYLSLPGMHQINQTSVTLGPTTFTVTNYGITSPSSSCNGSGVQTFSKFAIQAGTVAGTKLTLVPLWSQAGTFTPTGSNSVLSSTTTVRITSVTKA